MPFCSCWNTRLSLSNTHDVRCYISQSKTQCSVYPISFCWVITCRKIDSSKFIKAVINAIRYSCLMFHINKIMTTGVEWWMSKVKSIFVKGNRITSSVSSLSGSSGNSSSISLSVDTRKYQKPVHQQTFPFWRFKLHKYITGIIHNSGGFGECRANTMNPFNDTMENSEYDEHGQVIVRWYIWILSNFTIFVINFKIKWAVIIQ